MIYPPLFALANASAAVKALVKTGTGPLRFYLFGEADQATARPYAVWQTVGGSPENYINQLPNCDDWSTQVDVYALSPSSARDIAKALMDAFEPHAYVTSYNGEYKEFETKLYRFSITVDWITHRP